MYKKIKRGLDIIFSLVLLIIGGIFLLIVGLIIKIDSPGPAIFKQERLGLNGKVFNIYKFRSMCQGAEKKGTGVYSLKGDPRVTKVGRFIRATSIDELPQLINILKGEMSIVGPRPALYNQIDLKEMRTEAGVHKLVPGLTGWAQINGRDEIPLSLKVKLDKEYLMKKSLFFDIKIIFMTVLSVIKSEGVQEGKADNNNDKVA